jgi:hypothetical protein
MEGVNKTINREDVLRDDDDGDDDDNNNNNSY